MHPSQFTIPFLTLFLMISCGGGGGSGGASAVSSGYSYVKVDKRIEDGSLGQIDSFGTSMSQTYNSELRSYHIGNLFLDESNLSFSTGTDSYGDMFITIDINKSSQINENQYDLNYQFSFTGNEVYEMWDLPSHGYVNEYYSNADLTAYGLLDKQQYAGVEYVDMMVWWMDYDNGLNDYVAFVYGDKTFSGDMPSGTATFNVKSMGFWSTPSEVYNFIGEGSFQANFSNMSITGTILNDYVSDRTFSWSQVVGASAGGISFNGDISGSSFEGTAIWAGSDEGGFSGNFFGPGAKEIGGEYSIFAEESGYSNWIIGSFIGCSGNC